MSMIEVKELRKSFGPIRAVDGVSFSVQLGDVLGFLGPNGAGKSTTMKMLSGFLAPDSGTALVGGHDVRTAPRKVQAAMGYLAENSPAYDEMTVEGFLHFICDVRGLWRGMRTAAVNRVEETCSLHGVMHQTIGTLSKGYRRRVGLAQALIHQPAVLILDEPTDGLDPNQKHEVRELIKGLAASTCIVISTHILEEVDAICNRTVIIDRGRVLADSTPQALCAQEGGSLDAVFRTLTGKQKTGGAA